MELEKDTKKALPGIRGFRVYVKFIAEKGKYCCEKKVIKKMTVCRKCLLYPIHYLGEKNKEVAILKYRDAWVIQYDIEQCERENGLSQEEKDFKLAHKKKKKLRIV